MQTATGVDDRPGLSLENLREVVDGVEDLLGGGGVLVVEVGVEDSDGGDVFGRGALVRCALFDGLGTDPCVLLLDFAECELHVEVFCGDGARLLDLVCGYSHKIVELKSQCLCR